MIPKTNARTRRSTALLLAGLACLALLAFGAAEPPRLVTRVLATVNGSAVTADDIEMLLAKDASEEDERKVVQQLVVERLIDQKAKEAQIDVTDERLTAAIQTRLANCGGKDGYATFLRRIGRTLDQDRLELRHALEGEEYIARCLGEPSDKPPDPKLVHPDLARSLQVSEVEMQACWKANRDQFHKKGQVHVGKLSAKKKQFASSDEARDALTIAIVGHPASDLKGLAEANPKFEFSEVAFEENSVASLIDALRTTVTAGTEGTVSEIAETDEAFLVAGVLRRDPDVVVTYTDAQDMVRAHLVAQKRMKAVRTLVDGLIAEAQIWPKDLFPAPAVEATPVAPAPQQSKAGGKP